MRNFNSFPVTMGLLAFLFGGCSKPSSPPAETSVSAPASSSNADVLKIAVFTDGRLAVNGKAASLDELRSSLKQLSGINGAVWYYREAGDQEPPPIAMEVMKAVVEARLPIRLSSRPDYSDSVGP
jgi:hypothetical protein